MRLGRVIIIIVIITLTIISGNVENVAAKNTPWWDFDVRTKLSPGVTPESVKARFEKYGREHSPIYKNIEWIFEESEKYGINAAYIIAKITWESGWGLDPVAVKHNNFGGLGGSSGAITYESVQAGITANIVVLKGYVDEGVATSITKKGVPLRTIREILPPYCNVNDGCNHENYVTGLRVLMESYGQTPDGELLEGNMTTAEMEEREDSIRDGEGNKIPIEYLYEQMDYREGGSIGVQEGDMWGKAGITTWLYVFSEGVQKWLFRIGWILSSLLLLYISTYLIVYMTVARGSHLQEYFPEKMVENGREVYLQGMDGIKQIVKRVVIVMVLVVLFGTGLYIYLMSLILGGIGSLLMK